MRITLITDRCFHGNRIHRNQLKFLDLFRRDILQSCGNLFRRRISAELLHQLTLHAHDLAICLNQMNRQANRSCLVSNRTGNRLADPPCCIGAELESLIRIKLISSLHQTDIAFLDQIQKLHAAANIFLGNRNNQTQVRRNKQLLRFFITLLHAMRDIKFLLCS